MTMLDKDIETLKAENQRLALTLEETKNALANTREILNEKWQKLVDAQKRAADNEERAARILRRLENMRDSMSRISLLAGLTCEEADE
jgi:hypothetical protein